MRLLLKVFFTILFTVLLLNVPTLKQTRVAYSIDNDVKIVQRPPLELEILEQLTVEQKVGQLFMFGFSGTTLNEDISDYIQNRYIGGVLLLGRNISSDEQLTSLNTQLQLISTLPLLISIDQEGGIVARLKGDSILTTAQKEMLTPEQAYQIAKSRGEMLKQLGINMNLAPVVEYITDSGSFMYQRVFRGSKEDVALKGESSIKGYTDSGISSVAKHYPGHSNLSPDSHYSLPKVYIDNTQWEEYIYPFKYLIEKNSVDVIMVGHILYPNIDSKVSTISNEILSKRLRDNLKYDGVLITDDMEMDSIEKRGEYCDIAKEALLAGNDILLYSSIPDVQKKVHECILAYVTDGQIPISIIDEKVTRVLKLKVKYSMVDYSTLRLLLGIEERSQN